MARRTFIIGGGRFGTHLATRLSQLGCEVTLADFSAKRVQELAEDGFRAVEIDSGDGDALRGAGVLDAEVAVVAIGENMKGSVLATLALKELKVRRIICRAVDERHAAVLERLGADHVIVPGRDMANLLAESIRRDSYAARMPLPGEYQLGQVAAGGTFAGRTLADLKLREKYKINVILVQRRHGDELRTFEPDAKYAVEEHDTLLVVGMPDCIDRFEAASRS